jgi:hypothetical protein
MQQHHTTAQHSQYARVVFKVERLRAPALGDAGRTVRTRRRLRRAMHAHAMTADDSIERTNLSCPMASQHSWLHASRSPTRSTHARTLQCVSATRQRAHTPLVRVVVVVDAALVARGGEGCAPRHVCARTRTTHSTCVCETHMSHAYRRPRCHSAWAAARRAACAT